MSASASESTPLLPPSPSPSPSPSQSPSQSPSRCKTKKENNKYVFYVCIFTLFIINAGASMGVPPITSILEDLLCERHYASEAHTNDLDCKIEPVQSSLTMLRGILGLITLIPGLVLGVPYAALAERWGVKRVLLLCVAGIALGEVWLDLICWVGAEWPLPLVYLSPAAYVLGGGPAVGGTLLYVLVADYSPEDMRAPRFFLMEAAANSGRMLGYMASSAIMDRHLWAAILTGLALVFAAFPLTLLFPDKQAAIEGAGDDDDDDGDENEDGDELKSKSTLATMRTALALFREQHGLLVLLLGYILRCLGNSVTSLVIMYAAKVFAWSYSRSGLLVSLENGTNLAALLLLPALDHLLKQRQTRQPTDTDTGTNPAPAEAETTGLSKHYALARGSAFLAAIGSLGMAVSRSPPPFICSVVLYGLSSGYGQSLRSILTLATPVEHRAITYSVMGAVEAAAGLVGWPLWPLVYQVGLKLGEDGDGSGFWVGLPFLVTAGLMVGVLGTLYFGRVRVRG